MGRLEEAEEDGLAPRRLRPSQSISRLLTSFAVLHTAHTGLNLLYTLVQLLVFAHGMDAHAYAEVIFLTAVGTYAQPLDQALGRANYIVLRPSIVGGQGGQQAEAMAFLYGQGLLLVLLSFAVPLVHGIGEPERYLGNALYLFSCLFTNYWSFIVQSTVWAADLGREFAALSLVRRAIFFLGLALFWITGNFLLFGLVAAFAILLFGYLVFRLVKAAGNGLDPGFHPGKLSGAGIRAHISQVWISILSSIGEFIVLNSPYVVLVALSGIGPILVAFDSVMKIGRLAMAGTRTFSEILLPRISRLLHSGEANRSRQVVLIGFVICLVATAIPATMVYFAGPWVFSLLFGHNNVLGEESVPVSALIIMTTGLFQPAFFFLGYLSMNAAIKRLTVTAMIGVVVYSALTYWFAEGMFDALWIFAAYFLAMSSYATFLALTSSPKLAR